MPRRKVDPRIERSRQVILQAVLDELPESGYGALAIEAVARRAGVGKATIYRHWPDKIALVADAFRLLQVQRDPQLAGTPREQLEQALRHVADIAADSPFSACLPALIEGAERDHAVRRFHHHFQAEARKPLVALIARTDPTVDAELAAYALLGAIFFARLMTSSPFPDERVPDLIDTVLCTRQDSNL